MDLLVIAIVGAILALLGWIALVALSGFSIPTPAPAPARPASSRAGALALIEQLQKLDGADIAGPCGTRLVEPDGDAVATLVVWHGFTNCPAQFAEVAEVFAANGLRVLLARMPRHGLSDVLNHELKELTDRELTEHTARVIDAAAGFGDPVWVMGLSAGGILAGWAAATRPEVQRVVLVAPFVAPKAIPLPVVRLLIRFRPIIPGMYFWWDPRKKENLGESPYVYPGFPLPGMVPFLHLGQALLDGRVAPASPLERAALVSNPGDFAIRRDVAKRYAERAFGASHGGLVEVTLDSELGWWHDFVDVHGPHGGPTEQVAEVFSAAFGIADDPSAGGAIVEPLPAPAPAERSAE